MFGYITAVIPALKDEQKERYHALYCGLCRSIQLRYGEGARLALSNDMTFLAMLLASLYEEKEKADTRRCLIHPVKPHVLTAFPAMDFAADMNMLLAWFKCQDDILDDHSVRARAFSGVLKAAEKSLRKQYPDQYAALAENIAKIHQLEKEGSQDIDRLCDLSGRMFAACFDYRRDHWNPLLQRVGYGLGAFVYLMDAYEDYEADRKHGRFNPLTELHQQADWHDIIRADLTMLIADASSAFELLPLEQDIDLLRNILYHGIWNHYHAMHRKDAGQEVKHDE